MIDPTKISAREPEAALDDVIGALIGPDGAGTADVLAQLNLLAQSPMVRAYERAMGILRGAMLEALVNGQVVTLPDGSLLEKHEVRGVIKGIDASFNAFNRLAAYAKSYKPKER